LTQSHMIEINEGEKRIDMVKRMLMLALLAVAIVLSQTGCNTVRGAGEDIESVGEELQD
jgi:predicted small secreted protein